MELCHLLTRSGLRYPEVSSKICHDSFSQLWNCVSLPWVIYYEAFYLHVVSSFSCIPVICLPNRHPHLLVVYPPVTNEEITTESQRYNCITRNGGNAIPKYAGPEAKGSNPTTGLTLIWARNPFRENFNHWQVSRKEVGQIFFKRRHGLINNAHNKTNRRTYPVCYSYISIHNLSQLRHVSWAGQRSWYSDCLRAARFGDGIPVGARFSSPVQTGPEAHPPSCTMGTGSFPGVKSGRGVTLTSQPFLVPLVLKEQSYSSTPLIGRTACTEPQCLHKGYLYLYLFYRHVSISIFRQLLQINKAYREIKMDGKIH